MTKAREERFTHRNLIQKMESLGYLKNPGDENSESECNGVCNGGAFMGLLASLCGEFKQFNDRLILINQTNDLKTKIEFVRKKLDGCNQQKEDKNIVLSVTDKKFLDIDIFFQCIEIFTQPARFPELFHEMKEDDFRECLGFIMASSKVLFAPKHLPKISDV